MRVSVVNVALRVSVWCGSCTLHERPSAHRVWACEGGEQREDREDPRSWHRVEGEEGTRRGQREDCEDPSSWRGGTRLNSSRRRGRYSCTVKRTPLSPMGASLWPLLREKMRTWSLFAAHAVVATRASVRSLFIGSLCAPSSPFRNLEKGVLDAAHFADKLQATVDTRSRIGAMSITRTRCQNCDFNAAALWCEQCELLYCATCVDVVHGDGEYRDHRTEQIGEFNQCCHCKFDGWTWDHSKGHGGQRHEYDDSSDNDDATGPNAQPETAGSNGGEEGGGGEGGETPVGENCLFWFCRECRSTYCSDCKVKFHAVGDSLKHTLVGADNPPWVRNDVTFLRNALAEHGEKGVDEDLGSKEQVQKGSKACSIL